MITDFSSLYAGHVDMDDVGYGGTPVNDRSFSDDHLATSFDKALAIVQLMDRMGYDSFWMAEHHFQPEGYECIPNLLLLQVHLAHLTKNIKFGCGFNIAPMWHPLRLAEDFAQADILTGGRVMFGVGRGYHTREVETFGSPLMDQDANRDLFEEQVEIIFKAFNERAFSHHGKNYQIPPKGVPYRGYELEEITLVPRPVNRPVECWQPIQGGTTRALDFMAKHGIKGLILGTHTDYVDEYLRKFQAANAKYGRELPLGGNLALGLWAYVEDTVEKAEKALEPLFEEHVKFAAPLGMLRYTDEQMKQIGPGGVARHIAAGSDFRDVLEKKAWFAGNPETTIAYLKEIEEKYPGIEQVMIGFPMGETKAQFKEQLTRFAKDIIPSFKPQGVVA